MILSPICCAAWKVSDCMVEKAEEKCRDTENKFEDNFEFIFKEVDAEFGVHINCKKGLVKCGSISNVKI
jgi:hypothetical protein